MLGGHADALQEQLAAQKTGKALEPISVGDLFAVTALISTLASIVAPIVAPVSEQAMDLAVDEIASNIVMHGYDEAGLSGEIRIWSEIDGEGRVVAWKLSGNVQKDVVTIWMDGRPHPSPNALHSWQGFSTGEWEGDMLKVTTTHLKEGWVRRNGLPRSDKATLVEYFIRNENYLTLATVVTDPVYRQAVIHRQAAVRTSRLIRTAPRPMTNPDCESACSAAVRKSASFGGGRPSTAQPASTHINRAQ
mgnify:CR=1 FL=1